MAELRIYLDSPKDRAAIARLFHVQKQVGAFYEGAASMGINGYRFSCRDDDHRNEFIRQLGDGWYKTPA